MLFIAAVDTFSVGLLWTTASVALIHAILGPDHWLPFVMLARARRWSPARTLAVTSACGLAHVVSSVGLGLAGVALGWGATTVAGVESARGTLAAWLLVAFGVAYAAWGLRRSIRRRGGLSLHEHGGHVHVHAHGEHVHHHGAPGQGDLRREPHQTTFWTLLVIFVLGPCEPMIPLLVAPAGRGQWALAGWAALLFSMITLVAMVGVVALARHGLVRLPLGRAERWSHALAGGAIVVCGAAVIALGI